MNSRSQKWAGISRPAMGTGCSVSAPPPQPSRPLRVPGMVKWKGRAALATGASSAIGYAVVRQLTEQGMNVVGCTRNIPKLELHARSYVENVARGVGKVRCKSSVPNAHY